MEAAGEVVPNYPNSAHHIVAGDAPDAQIARRILQIYLAVVILDKIKNLTK